MIITECVLIYLKPDDSKKILEFIKTHFHGDLSILNYEMINPSDPFGKVMLENLEVIQISLSSYRIVDVVYKGFMSIQTKRNRIKG